jgi:hypothetical protein
MSSLANREIGGITSVTAAPVVGIAPFRNPLGVRIDQLTGAQKAFLQAWEAFE